MYSYTLKVIDGFINIVIQFRWHYGVPAAVGLTMSMTMVSTMSLDARNHRALVDVELEEVEFVKHCIQH